MNVNLQKNSAPLITRFAPSPTGYLHLGHIVSMAFVYGIARAAQAKLLLRIEDHDRGRCRPEYEQAIFDDLKWLGFNFDEQPQPGTTSRLRQSDRTSRYLEITDDLLARNAAYRCICTRSQIQKKMQAATPADPPAEELFYDGTCRAQSIESGAKEFGIRLIASPSTVKFTDGLRGPQAQNPSEQCGDFLIRDRHGNYTYQFGVAVDDFDQQVNLIIRGEDLLAATGRQIYSGGLLGRTKPAQFIHHPLVTDENGKKLSKRFFSEAVAKKRSEGLSAQTLLGQALFHVGLLDKERAIDSSELSSLFKIRISDDDC